MRTGGGDTPGGVGMFLQNRRRRLATSTSSVSMACQPLCRLIVLERYMVWGTGLMRHAQTCSPRSFRSTKERLEGTKNVADAPRI